MSGPEHGHNTPSGENQEAAVLEAREGVKERRMSNGKNGHGVWRWIAASLLAVLMLLIGGMAGDWVASFRYSRLHGRMTEHERMVGHPVMVQRVTDQDENNRESLERIEEKLNRQSIILREIEKTISDQGR